MKISKEQLVFLKKIIKGHSCQEIADLLNKKFSTNYRASQIKDIKRKYKLKSGYISKVNSGSFKKGQKAHNKKNIGDEFIDKGTGYIYIKVAEPNTWVQKQRYVYEKEYGEIQKGYSVIFLNQNKTDCRIENLALVRNKDKLVCKNKKMFSSNPDITKLGILTAKMINTTKSKRKEYI